MNSVSNSPGQKRVAVIGAGAAGLVTARELLRTGHGVQVYEQDGDVGGVWRYCEAVESDPLGQCDDSVHSSMYASLRTNLPRDVMAFLDYTFDSSGGGRDDWPRFPHHTQVCEYLTRFAEDFDLRPVIRCHARVQQCRRSTDGWQIVIQTEGGTQTETFDAVAVCNGHYAKPRVPALPGMERFPGMLMHSHSYRRPDGFRDQTVAVLGASASGADIHREIASMAGKVLFCAEEFRTLPAERRQRDNVAFLPNVMEFREDGTLLLVDESVTEPVDSFVFCTGYHFDFPFLDEDVAVVRDNWMPDLYQHLISMKDPSLAFIGIPMRIVPFPLFQMQARWFAALVQGEVQLPSSGEMMTAVRLRREAIESVGGKQHNYHLLGDDMPGYYAELAAQCGEPPLPEWFEILLNAHFDNVRRWKGDYHDAPLPDVAPTRVITEGS